MLSKRLTAIPESPIRKLVPYAVAAKLQGVIVYHLNIGDPDIETPKVMLDVLSHWKKPTIGYDQSQGNPDFINSLLWYYHKLGYTFLESKHIQITFGGSEAIYMAMFATTNPGDEILVFEPFFSAYNSFASMCGVTLSPVTTKSDNGFHLPKISEIENKITKKTKAILFCNPSNPTGTVFRKDEVEALVGLVKKYKLYLYVDEVYREFTYDGRIHSSLLSYMQEIPEHAILLDSMSKRYSLCGARLGVFISLNKELMAGVLRIAQGRLSAGYIDQQLARELTRVPDAYFREVNNEYKSRRDVVYEGLRNVPGVVIPKPEGAFYVIVGLSIKDAEDFCMWLLTDFRHNNETIMLAPAAGFYATPGMGKQEVRIAYVINKKSLTRSIELLTLALRQYKKLHD